MYVVTFYSFKGGVGRTMALANVALALANAGRSVLIVDFDLEAPGIDTFELLKPKGEPLGLIDFVTDYVVTQTAPDVRDYVYQPPNLDKDHGRLWVMPAGRRDLGYAARLNAIDWEQLYARQDGYLLLEDLKAQWARTLKPDYVLIDSRTGHTDVGGICTRQLPDAVVILFFPNEQNLLGLSRVVPEIRGEAAERRKEPIELHFVPSNVPDLDDEDHILADRIKAFRARLGYESPATTIHHYDSLALLNQMIFAVERPQTRLAREYGRLQKEIVKRNARDRDGALQILVEWADRSRPMRSLPRDAEVLGRIRAIEEAHGNDQEVLYWLAVLNDERGRTDEARRLLDRALDVQEGTTSSGPMRAEILTRRARLGPRAGMPEDEARFLDDLEAILKVPEATLAHLRFAVGTLSRLRPASISTLPESPAYQRLAPEDRCALLGGTPSQETLPLYAAVVTDLVELLAHGQRVTRESAVPLSLGLIALGRFGDAMALLGPHRPDESSTDIVCVFNYAMAEWAASGSPPRDLFQLVVALDDPTQAKRKESDPNYLQCLAIAYWAVGNQGDSLACVQRARDSLDTQPYSDLGWFFSAWRYLSVERSAFLQDMSELNRMIHGEALLPAFMRRIAAQPAISSPN